MGTMGTGETPYIHSPWSEVVLVVVMVVSSEPTPWAVVGDTLVIF